MLLQIRAHFDKEIQGLLMSGYSFKQLNNIGVEYEGAHQVQKDEFLSYLTAKVSDLKDSPGSGNVDCAFEKTIAQ